MPRKYRVSKAKARIQLETMSNDELQEVRFFGNLCKNPHTITFAATPEEVKRAVEILEERGTLNTIERS